MALAPARKRKITRIVAVLVWIVLVVAGLVAWRFYGSLKGPPVPECALPALERKTFEAPVQLSSATTPGALQYDIEPTGAVMDDGTLALAWNQRGRIFSGSRMVTARLFTDGGVEARSLPMNRSDAFDAWMTKADDGVLHLVWLAHNGGLPEREPIVAHVTSPDGVTWSAITEGDAPSDCPDAGLGCFDKPMVAPIDGGVAIFYFAATREGLCVTTPGADASVKVAGGAYADVFRSRSGALHVAVVDDAVDAGPIPDGGKDNEFGTTSLRAKYARSDDDGATWTSSFASEPDEQLPFFFSNPQVVVDEGRNLVYVAYPSGPPSGAWMIRLATSADQGKTWSHVTVNDDPPCASHMTPHLALDEQTGVVHVTWLENRSGKGGLAWAACEPGGAKCGKNEAVSTPFASYSYERHLPGWLSEYGLLELDPRTRTLHAVWTQPVEENGHAVSRIFHARARLGDPAAAR